MTGKWKTGYKSVGIYNGTWGLLPIFLTRESLSLTLLVIDFVRLLSLSQISVYQYLHIIVYTLGLLHTHKSSPTKVGPHIHTCWKSVSFPIMFQRWRHLVAEYWTNQQYKFQYWNIEKTNQFSMAEKYDTICFICNANYKQVQTLLGSKTTWLALEAERLFRLVFYWFIDVQHVFEPFDSIPWGIFWLWSTSLFGSASFYIRHMEAGKSLWEYQVPFLK